MQILKICFELSLVKKLSKSYSNNLLDEKNSYIRNYVIPCISGGMYNVQLEIGIYAFENEDSGRRTRVFCPQETSATGIADR